MTLGVFVPQTGLRRQSMHQVTNTAHRGEHTGAHTAHPRITAMQHN